jgi:cell wall-associated NlpC family hydrolase
LVTFLLLSSGFLRAEAQVDPNWLYAVAQRVVGHPYLWGGDGYGGFDCSGLVVYVYRHLGVNLPRTSHEQYAQLPKVKDYLLPGDLLFFSASGKKVDHVGIFLYAQGGKLWMLHASGKWGRVVVEPVENYLGIYVGAARPLRSPPAQPQLSGRGR